MNVDEIKRLIPHRYPFLFLDKIIEMEKGKRIVALKNLTINEPFFQGHFPDYPVMPGVLMLEAMAQAGAVLLLSELDNPNDYVGFLGGIDKARFKKPARPGDTLLIEVTVDFIRRNVSKVKGKITINGELVAEAEIYSAIKKKEEL